jgi:hypothetical protein
MLGFAVGNLADRLAFTQSAEIAINIVAVLNTLPLQDRGIVHFVKVTFVKTQFPRAACKH